MEDAVPLQSSSIVNELRDFVSHEFRHQSVPLWLLQLSCTPAVERTLERARCALRELGVPDGVMDDVPPNQVAISWTNVIQTNADPVSSGVTRPDIVDLQNLVVRDLAASVYHAWVQRKRNLHLWDNGAPVGMQTFPVMASSEKVKDREVAWGLRSQVRPGLFREYMSNQRAMRRRVQHPRSHPNKGPDDLVGPWEYSGC